MQIRSLTKRKIIELNNLYESKLAEYNSLNNKTSKILWKEDLDNFVKVYNEDMKDYNNRYKDN